MSRLNGLGRQRKRPGDGDLRSLPRLAPPLHHGAHLAGSFTHADAAKMTRLAVGFGVGIETTAIVSDTQRELGCCGGKMQVDL